MAPLARNPAPACRGLARAKPPGLACRRCARSRRQSSRRARAVRPAAPASAGGPILVLRGGGRQCQADRAPAWRASSTAIATAASVHRAARPVADRHRIKRNVALRASGGLGRCGAGKVRNLRAGPDLEPVAGEARDRRRRLERMMRRRGDRIGRGERAGIPGRRRHSRRARTAARPCRRPAPRPAAAICRPCRGPLNRGAARFRALIGRPPGIRPARPAIRRGRPGRSGPAAAWRQRAKSP